MAAKTVELTIKLTEAELETLDKFRKGSSRAAYVKKLILEKGISKSGLPYTGDPDTDEILDDPIATQRLLDYEKNPPSEEDLIPWEEVEAELSAEKSEKALTYKVVLTRQARADLEAVSDLKTREAIRREILALRTNPAVLQRKMSGNLKNYYRVRAAGQTYRILYAVVEDEVRVLVVLIGPRKAGSQEDVYVEAERRLRLYQAQQKPQPEQTTKPRKKSDKKPR